MLFSNSGLGIKLSTIVPAGSVVLAAVGRYGLRMMALDEGRDVGGWLRPVSRHAELNVYTLPA